jgi:hypothetical protein
VTAPPRATGGQAASGWEDRLPQIDRVDAVEVCGRLVGCVARGDLDAGVVERHVEPAEGVDRPLDEGGDLVLIGHDAGEAERVMTGGRQLVRGCAERLLVDVGEHDGGAGFPASDFVSEFGR